MRRILKVLDVVYNKVTKQDWDNVLIIGGDEGIGKSTLALHIFEYWYRKLEKDGHVRKLDPEHLIQFIALSMDQFLKGFRDLDQFYLELYDEAGELSSLRMMNKFNYAVSKTYEVVRGENLFSIIVVPDVFYLNPFFSARRARGYIHVYKRGRCAYWGKKKLRETVELNKTFRQKTPFRVAPLFYDTFPMYKGIMLEHYKEKKKAKMEQIRSELYDKLVIEESEKHDFLKYIYNATKLTGQKLTMADIGKIFEVSERTIYNKRDEFRELQKKEGIVAAD